MIKKPTAKDLFFFFLKAGTFSFGGNMALVTWVEKEICKKKQWLDVEDISDSIAIAGLLPGALAVNVITRTGYLLAGFGGAVASFVGVLIPSFVLITFLSFLYMQSGDIPAVTDFMKGALPVIIAVIFTTALNLAKRYCKDFFSYFILAVACILTVLPLHFNLIVPLIIIFAGISGYFFAKPVSWQVTGKNPLTFPLSFWIKLTLSLIFPFLIALLFFNIPILKTLSSVFYGVSVSLFGGGYVMIPMLKQIIVENNNWLRIQEFTDGITLGQVTPGPVLITAAFIGYKVAGLPGALVSTLSVFVPASCIMLAVSAIVNKISAYKWFTPVINGIRPAVAGLILGASGSLTWSAKPDIFFIVLFISSVYIILNKNWPLAIMIPASGVSGIIYYALI